jgi:epoxyqueuosine reductase
MSYLHRNRDRILDPQKYAPGARSTISLGYDYGNPGSTLIGGGRVARYATGRDYHRFLGKASAHIRRRLEAEGIEQGSMKIGPDAVPVLERALATRAGIGFLAKSAGVIHPNLGPYLLLSEVLVPLELPPDPLAAGSCGTCTACLDACPTDAITAPREVDATLCLSYTTIELRGFIPKDLREPQGDRLFGCDICLEVCPFSNRGRAGLSRLAQRPPEMRPHPVIETYDLVGVLSLTQEEYDRDWVGTAMRRATRSGLRRNAAVVLGNLRDESALPALGAALDDADPVVRGHAAWALGQIGSSHPTLSRRLSVEEDERVGTELRDALES